MENSRDKVIEKEKVMAMKYGIILSQNKELIDKLQKKKQENDELKAQIKELKQKEANYEFINQEFCNKRMNMTVHKRDDSSPIMKRPFPNSYSSSSFITNYNVPDGDGNDRFSLKVNDKSSELDALSTFRKSQRVNNDDEVTQSKSDFDLRSSITNFTSMSTQEALNLFSPDKQELVKMIVNKLVSEKRHQIDFIDQNPSSTVEF